MRGEQQLFRRPVEGASHPTGERIAESLASARYPLGQFYYDARRWSVGADVDELGLNDEQVAYLEGIRR